MTGGQLLEENYLDKRIPDQEFEERAQKIRGALDEASLEVGIAYATEHMPGDVQYLTGSYLRSRQPFRKRSSRT
jgi:hypothetical protein